MWFSSTQESWVWHLVHAVGWNEQATTNAPIEDEAVQAVLRMNQKIILPARNY
jgi:hypothetical protein